ncbi:hypothetical protein J6590_038523 [Homalodisca vitripennis]|nr:hypothetical protein J6590_038523 [Homalodisca vitripennis]
MRPMAKHIDVMKLHFDHRTGKQSDRTRKYDSTKYKLSQEVACGIVVVREIGGGASPRGALLGNLAGVLSVLGKLLIK